MRMAKKIYINPGHSNTDPGAVGYETERELNVKVSNYMKDYLLANYSCEIKMNPGTVSSLTSICQDANNWKADLFVSNHFNAGGGDGYEALVYSSKTLALGQIFEKHVKAIGQNSRGVKYRTGLTVLKNTNMPAVLNEGAFVDNWNDIQDWNDENELKKLGEAYAKAAAEYLNLPRVAASSTTKAEDSKTPESNTAYTLTQFIKDVQAACGAKVDGIAGPETLRKTVTLSATKNTRHTAVKAVQKRLLALGYKQVGTIDGIAGSKFTAAVKAYQKDNGCVSDGEVTARGKTWRKLLGTK